MACNKRKPNITSTGKRKVPGETKDINDMKVIPKIANNFAALGTIDFLKAFLTRAATDSLFANRWLLYDHLIASPFLLTLFITDLRGFSFLKSF